MIRYLTAGESHGKALTVIIEGVPAGLKISKKYIETELQKRKQGYGRGPRQKIETDEIEILSGIRFGETIASPIAILLKNKDFINWQDKMNPEENIPNDYSPLTCPRPGHADHAGIIKYNFQDIRNVLERSSARETAMRVVVGAIAKKILTSCKIKISSYVYSIGSIYSELTETNINNIEKAKNNSELGVIDKKTEKEMITEIDKAQSAGVTLGGKFRIVVNGVPTGLGSYVHWDRKLDANIAKSIMSIQAIKGVDFGLGFKSAELSGDKIHDSFTINHNKDNDAKNYFIKRVTNNSGGIEGGMTNGESIIVNVAMKPIPTMKSPLQSYDINTKKEQTSFYERSDVTAVTAASVIGESVVAVDIVNAILERFGADTMKDLQSRIK